MEITKFTFKDIFEMIHDENNKRFYGQLILVTRNDANYSCALSDESVRYGTDDYQLFEEAIKKDFTPTEAEQILSYEFKIILGISYFSALDTAMNYLESDSGKKITLYVNAYPKDEYEETKAYKSKNC